MTLPWLLIDIDGVLNPFWSNSETKQRGVRVWHAESGGHRYRMLLQPEHGEWLLGMRDAFRLAWCTTWQHDANGPISDRLGLPHLPVVEFDFTESEGSKVPGIERFTNGDPFCWIDDDVWGKDRRLLAGLTQPHRVVQVKPYVGLEQSHLKEARAWALTLPIT